jgi:hypothetical protein
MDTLGTSLGLTMALDYLHERARERNPLPDEPPRPSILRMTVQIVGRALMTTGLLLQMAGKQLIILSQKSTS